MKNCKDIREITTFKRFGATFTKVYADDVNHIYIFSKKWVGCGTYFEVIKGVRTKTSDGSVIYRYPSSSEFGTHAFDICGANSNYRERIEYRVNQLRERAQESSKIEH